MVSERFLWYCLTVRNPQIIQASERCGFRHTVVFENSISAYQEKMLTTAYRVVIHPLHNILLASPPVGANAFC